MTDREKLIELLSEAEKVCFVPMWLPPEDRLHSLFSQIADHLLANGVTVQTQKEKPTIDLTNKCGSCKHSVIAENVFGKSECYVRCTNNEHLTSRMYQERPIAAVRQRTMKACKNYEPLPEPPKEE